VVGDILYRAFTGQALTPTEVQEVRDWANANQDSAALIAGLFSGSGNVPNLATLSPHTGRLSVDLMLSSVEGSYGSNPTDTSFTGVFFSGTGITFAEGTFNIGAVAAGALQAGFNTAGKFIAGAGAVTVDADGMAIEESDIIDVHNSIKWYSGANLAAAIAGVYTGGTYYFYINQNAVSGNDSKLRINAYSPSGFVASLIIKAEAASSNLSPSIELLDNGTTASIAMNVGGKDVDTVIKGLADDNLLYVDASTDRVGIGTATPATKLQVEGAVTLLESAAPSTPASGYGAIFQDTGSRPSAITDTALVGALVVAPTAVVNASATSGTGETILATYTIPAGVLEHASQGVRITAFVDTTTGASTKTWRLRFGGIGGTILVSDTTTGAVRARIMAHVWRTGATTQEAFADSLDSAGNVAQTTTSPT